MKSNAFFVAPWMSRIRLLHLPATLVLIAGLLAATASESDQLSPFDRDQLHAYEQCANACQINLDDRMFKCMPYRKDKEKKVKEDCPETAYEKYDKCESKCPVNPRAAD